MVATLLHSAILSALEASLNQVLSLDPLARKKLEPLSGKILSVHCELPNLIINIMVSDDRVLLSSNKDLTADTRVSGKASALLKLLINRKTASLKSDGVVITGNTGLLTALQEILQNLDLDWEYQLSKFIGDVPTQAVADGFHSASNFTRQSQENLHQDIDDYLHQEKKILPTREELNIFYQSVDSLRLSVDRLDSRVSRLTTRLPD